MLTKSLCWIALGVLAACAYSNPQVQKELEERNRELERQVADQTAEVHRLNRFLEPGPEPVDALEQTAKVPLKVLKPTPPKPEPVEVPSASDREVVATSEHESLAWYEQGRALMKEGQYDASVSAFTRFLQTTPDHVYADHAQFWIGECHFRDGEFGLSLIADNRFLTRFPTSQKVPDTLFRMALAHLAMGHTAPAATVLREILRQYPLNEAAGKASQKLAEIRLTRSQS